MWNPIWRQAMTCFPLGGKAFGISKTSVFTVHVPADGRQLRFQFSNRFGKVPYEIAAMTVLSGSHRYRVTVDGKTHFFIPCSRKTYSDPLPAALHAGEDLEIRLFFEHVIADCNMIEEKAALLSGDQTEGGPFVFHKPLVASAFGAYNPVPTVESVEMDTPEAMWNIAAFGDSLTALSRWTKPLARRVEKAYGGKAVLLNSGISGNSLLYERGDLLGELYGEMGIRRFERDVLEIPGLEAAIIGIGVNDVSYYSEKTKDQISLEHFRQAVTWMTDLLHARGVRVTMQTITPRLGVPLYIGRYTQEMENQRLLFNEWIRSSTIFDYVFDAEAVVSEHHADGIYYAEGLHQGDHLHPGPEGGRKLADAFDLEKVTGRKENVSAETAGQDTAREG